MEFQIWTEKYRPQEFEDVVGQDEIVERLKALVKSRQIPHLLFAGPAGSGKSTIALIIARKLFEENWKQNFLELNASDERGINIIRSKVKDFARSKAFGFPYKIIFLDEADSLTADAQHALRRTMETYSNVCRFFLSCNYSSKIIEPIQSRCAVFRFKRISSDAIEQRLGFVSEKEKLKIEDKALDAICELSEGDIRKAINILQSAAAHSKRIKEKTVYEVESVAEPKEVKEMLEKCMDGSFEDSRKILKNLLFVKGVSGEDILKQIASNIHSLDISERQKISLIEKIGEFEFRLNQGGDEHIQLEALLASLALRK